MRIGSLCSGAGGLDMAVEAVFGAETVWHCEIDDAASKVLAYRWPGVPNHRDLISTDWTAVEPIDILCAGWPCQPFSLAGKRKGADDERAIWPHIAGAVRVLRPRIVVLENVTAVLAVEFGRVADSLAALGYDLRWTSLRASDVGAPHRRERLFVVATDTAVKSRRIGNGNDVRAWSGAGRHTQATGRSGDAADSPRNGRDEGWPESARLVGGSDAPVSSDGPVELLPTPAAQRSGRNQSPSPGAAIRPSLDSITDLLPTPRKSDGDGGANPLAREERMDDVETRVIRIGGQWGKYEPAIRRWEQSTRPAPAPTEPNTKGNPRLAPAFSEWMMGWPAGLVTDLLLPMKDPRPDKISRNEALRIIGNGVVPQQATAALRWLLNVSQVAA